MPAKLLIAAVDGSSKSKGDIASLVPQGGDFGSRETLPNWVQLTLTDTDNPPVEAFLDGWEIIFEFDIQQDNPQRYLVVIRTRTDLVSSSRGLNVLSQEMADWTENQGEKWEAVTVQSNATDNINVRILKGQEWQTTAGLSDQEYLDVLLEDFNAFWVFFEDKRRYALADSDVDAAVAGDGTITWTFAEFQANVQDKVNL